MNKEEILNLLLSKEKVDLEYKLSKNEIPKSIYQTVCAFNNRIGGYILLGINDEREIVGVEEEVIDKMLKDFTTSINDSNLIYPPLYLTPNVVDINGKKVIAIYVPEGKQVCQYKKEYWDRIHEGDINITKNIDLISTLFARKQSYSFVNKVYTSFGLEHLNTKIIQRARKLALARDSKHKWGDMSDEELLKSSGLMVFDPQTGKMGITLACILLFGEDITIMSVLPNYKTDAIFRVVNIDRYDDRKVIITNLIDSFYELMDFGEKHLNDLFVLDGTQRVSARNIILREIVSNLLVHRDFSSNYPAKLIIEENQIVTENSNIARGNGELELGVFNPFPKNPPIAKVFREIGLADELGSGMRNTNKYVRLYSGQKPTFLEKNIFKTVIPIKEIAIQKVGPDKVPISADKVPISADKVPISEDNYLFDNNQLRYIVDFAKNKESFTKKEIETLLGIKDTRAKILIRKLVEQGFLEKLGENRNRRYQLKKIITNKQNKATIKDE
ncbi:helix-turn-helix domain-containing protein [Mycoplasmopsis gallopavonis]|uniref:Divergent AAA domain n=1 Tax=Mycoplasmopsis gallopavonis TaxID=76629 RepID=A0A449AZ43_9BACT|nr:RNA-binding domain-containing protein [Mycoplasmopsis gallopavonis]RIV16971.1 ATP-dependent DNA helicase RecG [Mycoplasmopsis gallopavonis]VEU72780.1 Divergent AAA domain [Mycoplasmopsis gallopavonis]